MSAQAANALVAAPVTGGVEGAPGVCATAVLPRAGMAPPAKAAPPAKRPLVAVPAAAVCNRGGSVWELLAAERPAL